jgi:hypothetical protein
LELDVIEDNCGNIMGVLLGENFIWTSFNLGQESSGVILDGFSDLCAGFSGMVVLLSLREADSE